jgi:hypothetical protein
MSVPQPVNTAKVVGRRELRFTTFSEVIADAERLAAAESAGTLKRLGNWTLGQAFNHIATWINFPFEGYPLQLTPPLWVKVMGRLMKKRLLAGGLRPGFRIPKIEGGTLGIEPISTADGLAKLRAAVARLDSTMPRVPNPVFGAISHDEWKKLHLGHAALHFSFYQFS